MEGRGHLLSIGSLLLSCGVWELNSGLPAWQHISLPMETSHWPSTDNFIVAW